MLRAVLYHPEQIQRHLDSGVDVDAIQKTVVQYTENGHSGKTEIDRTYLTIAVRHDCPDAVRELLACGADPNLGVSAMGYTALTWAVRVRHIDIARMLLDAGADPNLRAKTPHSDGQAPVLWAARKNDPEILRLLLSRGAGPLVKDLNGMTAMDYAEIWKREEIKSVLAQHDAISNPAID
ncbi:MAG: ankyrin repeat domain-containing protein [Planctomycetota bacterium]